MDLSKISFLNNAVNIQKVNEGYSGAQKFTFEKDNKKYFIKLGNFHFSNELIEYHKRFNIPVPKIVDFSSNGKLGYIIYEFIEGQSLKYCLNDFHEKYTYEFGFQLGEQYRKFLDIYPIKKLDDNHKQKLMKEVEEITSKLEALFLYTKDKLNKETCCLLTYLLKYLKNKISTVLNGIMIFSHPDMKPNNVIINKRKPYIIDIEHTGYVSLAKSLRYSVTRTESNYYKSWYFARGYLDSLFNFNVPKSVLKELNYYFLMCSAKHFIDKLEKGKFDSCYEYARYIQSIAFHKGKICLEKYFPEIMTIFDIKPFKDCKFNNLLNSHTVDNLVFKCIDRDKEYFVKVIKTPLKNFKNFLLNYKICTKAGVPISKLRYYTESKNKNYVVAFYDYIDYPELSRLLNNYDSGLYYGKLIANELKKLNSVDEKNIKFYDIEAICKQSCKKLDFIYDNNYEKIKNYIPYSKEQLQKMLDTFKQSYRHEPFHIIHGDIKGANILYDKGNICFVDIESISKSYDIINFLWNYTIVYALMNLENGVFRGFVIGYLKTLNNGKIPKRIQGQAKYILVSSFIQMLNAYVKEQGRLKDLESYIQFIKKYVINEENIEWLK